LVSRLRVTDSTLIGSFTELPLGVASLIGSGYGWGSRIGRRGER
jgi:hypothetical protein